VAKDRYSFVFLPVLRGEQHGSGSTIEPAGAKIMTEAIRLWHWARCSGWGALVLALVVMSGLTAPVPNTLARPSEATIEAIAAQVEAHPPAGLARGTAVAAPDPAASLLAAKARVQSDFGRVPMHFEPNVGQAAEEVRYLARGAGYSLFLTDTEAVLILRRGRAAGTGVHPETATGAGSKLRSHLGLPAFAGPSYPRIANPLLKPLAPLGELGWEEGDTFDNHHWPVAFGDSPPSPRPLSRLPQSGWSRHRPPDRLAVPEPSDPPQTAVVRMRLDGTNRHPQPKVAGLERQPGISNYYLGNDPAKWRSGVPHYVKVQYDQVYPGIDLVYYGNPRQLEYDLVVAPGADPGQIRLSFAGVDEMRIDGEGNLVLAVAGGEIVQQAPRVFQLVEGQERLVAGRYVMFDEGGASAAGGDTAATLAASPVLGIALASYDAGRPLVIDPVVIYSTYLGGSSGDYGYGIAVDGAGNAYVTGNTYSIDFPTVNARYPSYGGGGSDDAFVTKFDQQGQGPVYSTYLGGNSSDGGSGIAVDGAGNAYVTGTTQSADFPTVNARYPTYGGGSDAFVTKLDPQGQGPIYSSYLGGSSYEDWTAIAVDVAGNAYVTGTTQSADFPTLHARYPNYAGGGTDAFVTQFDLQGQGPVYSTYLGGSSYDFGISIAGNYSATPS
jgi:hypothetical protein